MAVLPEGYRGRMPRQERVDLAELLVAMEERRILSVVVTQVLDREIFVLLGSGGLGGPIFGVMPPEEFDEKIFAGYEGFVGEVVDVLVTGYDAERKLVGVSRRQARLLKRHELLQSLDVGQVVTGVVRALQPYGAFVDIGGLHAILPVGEMRYEYVVHPKEVLNRGDVVSVRVTSLDRATLRVRVSLKAVVDPWERAEGLYRPGAILLGAIANHVADMVWVRPEPYYGLEILCPAIPGRVYQVGSRVRARLHVVDGEARKLRGRIIGGAS
jgi:ribosomal protein S1